MGLAQLRPGDKILFMEATVEVAQQRITHYDMAMKSD